jgi:hypothetical protein
MASVIISGSSSVGRAIAFQAIGRGFEPRLPLNLVLMVQLDSGDLSASLSPAIWVISRCSSVVEHFLGKEEVWGSIPHNGSKKWKEAALLLSDITIVYTT